MYVGRETVEYILKWTWEGTQLSTFKMDVERETVENILEWL